MSWFVDLVRNAKKLNDVVEKEKEKLNSKTGEIG